MSWASRTLTVLSIAATLAGLTWYAIAAGCTESLPGDKTIPGWTVLDGSTSSGKLGDKAGYDAYDGAVGPMRKQRIQYFAQRMYRNAKTKQYVTVDIYQLSGARSARALYDSKLRDSRKAKPLYRYTSIKDRAFVCTMGGCSFGVCQRGKYVCSVVLSKASSGQSRTSVRSFLKYVSGKLKS